MYTNLQDILLHQHIILHTRFYHTTYSNIQCIVLYYVYYLYINIIRRYMLVYINISICHIFVLYIIESQEPANNSCLTLQAMPKGDSWCWWEVCILLNGRRHHVGCNINMQYVYSSNDQPTCAQPTPCPARVSFEGAPLGLPCDFGRDGVPARSRITCQQELAD